MSETVCKALKLTGDEEVAETAQFIEMVDFSLSWYHSFNGTA